MSTPRLVIDLDKIEHNATTLVSLLATKGISVTGVTKSLLGAPEVAAAMLRGGVVSIGDSRVENLERLSGRSRMLIRSPMLTQVDRVVAAADISCNSEAVVLQQLGAAAAAQGRTHGVMIMVELGDLREGAMPCAVAPLVQCVLEHPWLTLAGIGTNLACQSGVAPDEHNMKELSRIVEKIESEFSITVDCVSGGNSANLWWALKNADVGRVNHLRLGESIVLGSEPLYQHPIAGLYTDAVALIAEVIESQQKPSIPWGDIATTAFGDAPDRERGGTVHQVLFALGRQDVDPEGLQAPGGLTILGASSDHLVGTVAGGAQGAALAMTVGSEARFGLNYSALLRAATSPFVHREYARGAADGVAHQ